MKKKLVFFVGLFVAMATCYAQTDKEKTQTVIMDEYGNPVNTVNMSNAEDSDFNCSVSLDFQLRYIWRGQPLAGSTPCLQPGTYFNWRGMEIGAWGSFALSSRQYAELDLYLSYTFWKDRFTVVFTDYGFPVEEDSRDFNFFDYKKNHVLELGFSYNGEEKVPISASVYVNLFGADAKKVNGKNVYSTYSELAYNPTWKRLGVDFSIFVGLTFNGVKTKIPTLDEFGSPILDGNGNSLMEEIGSGFYGNKEFAVVNTGVSTTKTFKVKKINIPLTTSLIFNPASKKAYFTVGMGIIL